MAEKVLVLLGTKKGAFIAESDASRRSWKLRGPFCETWPINHVVADHATGTIWGAGGNEWFGPAVWKSTDLGATWTHSSEGLAYAEGEEPIKAVWSLAKGNGSLYAGVQPAGLFRSDDDGQSWSHVENLQKHPSRPHWNPGGAGLILHSLVLDPDDHDRIWIGISAAGVFYSGDGGQSWEPRNLGTREGELMRQIILPAAMPMIFTGLQVALPIAMIVAVVCEMLMGGYGIGGAMMTASRFANSAGVFAGIVEIAVVGFVLVKAMAFIRRRLLAWHPESLEPSTV